MGTPKGTETWLFWTFPFGKRKFIVGIILKLNGGIFQHAMFKIAGG